MEFEFQAEKDWKGLELAHPPGDALPPAAPELPSVHLSDPIFQMFLRSCKLLHISIVCLQQIYFLLSVDSG